jgi:hypothetical protein
MQYPGRIIQKDEADINIVKAIQKRLNECNCGPLQEIGIFGPKTVQAVKLFQSLNKDSNNLPLVADGKIGSLTWEALFGAGTVPLDAEPPNLLLKKVMEKAYSQIGVKENPLGSNGGPEVDRYLASVGLGTGFYWCMAFVYWCFQEGAKELRQANPAVKTGGVLKQWNQSTGRKILSPQAIQNPSLIKPGHIFIMDFGGGKGHTGLVFKVEGGNIRTIEGNSSSDGSRNGIAVVDNIRKINSINRGFIEYK